MRTTITLDDDVAAKLKEEMAVSGRSFKETVNLHLRASLVEPPTKARKPFKVRDIGLRLGLDFTSTSRFLEELEGPLHR
ncbi:MAG: hypothetical protein NTZ56_03520 [Acidobacteria bacterium]|nr:hypothetical protein [Acidobacteriota bacterium]